ncbi:hypothetical protein [Rhodococcus sp. NPDC127528]|uniref:hypothetical protein n=1 Tax=unclassified Rhodococcus (in: high G+C Gram-positive bacteria) TaxID=192944 RepID=UPI00362C259E
MTTKTRIPFAPAAVRDFLKRDADFTAVVPAELISTRDVPRMIDRPFVTCRSAMTGGPGDPMMRTPLVQVDVWVPKSEILAAGPMNITADPEEVAWDIAGLAGEIIGRARAVPFRNCSWNGDWKDGPMNMIDKTRGVENPLYRAPVRVELSMRMTVAPTFTWL